jgi:shikimate kinase
LDTPFELCWSRIAASADDRPLGRTREQAQALYDARRTTYQLAGIHVKVSAGESLAVLAARIQAELFTGFQD